MKKFLIVSLCLNVMLLFFFAVWDEVRAVAQEDQQFQCYDANGDGTIDLSDPTVVLRWLFLGGHAPEACPRSGGGEPVGLADTGQSLCYDRQGKGIPCSGDTGLGQDGFYQIGCPSEGRFIDNEDGTVTDNCTGLMWQKDTADTNDDGLSDSSDTLLWWDALAYCENLEFAGHDDWRLPNVAELHSIVDYGPFDPTIDPIFGAFSSFYWSSTSLAVNPGYAWPVRFDARFSALNGNKASGNFVRAVRGGP